MVLGKGRQDSINSQMYIGGTWSSSGSPRSLDKSLLDYSIKVGCYFQRLVELMRLLINECDIIMEVGEVKL